MAGNTVSLPYEEPGIALILVQASFVLLLNVVNSILDRLVYCGLLGQVLIGIAWGSPGAKWLSTRVEEVVVQLGYLGLILLVYEGGLSTSFTSLKANLLLSSAVALTGIGFPIALSYSLQGLVGATALQAFAAGAALCSTSLGTTFTVLNSSGLSNTRLGVVLSSAAMMDDVVGLVMVQVISNLGAGNISPVTIVRPVLVSIAFAAIVPLICYFTVKPLTLVLNSYREAHPSSKLHTVLCHGQTAFVIHTLLLIALVTGSSFAGTSNLFAAYIAGAVISWWDTELPHPTCPTEDKLEKCNEGTVNTTTGGDGIISKPSTDDALGSENRTITPSAPQNEKDGNPAGRHTSSQESETGPAIYEHYYQQAVSRILQPFFFASIGFSIPITRMFSGSIIWRGIVYAILMTFGKMVCGLWLVRIPVSSKSNRLRGLGKKLRLRSIPHIWGKTAKIKPAKSTTSQEGADDTTVTARTNTVPECRPSTSTHSTPYPPKPFSIHPPLIMSLAMTARGEIGFLISAVAEANGVFSSSSTSTFSKESDIFLIVTWAIVLCTMIGPLGVGLLVRRVKALEEKKEREMEGGGRDVLGVWGVQ